MALDSDEQYVIALSYGTIVGTGLLALLVCGARLATRKFLLKAWSADDWATLVALTITTAFNVIGVFVVVNGAGRHIQHVSPDHLKVWFLVRVPGSPFFFFAGSACLTRDMGSSTTAPSACI